jgi:endoplasmic reticulum Man9GlcNAc2 1,2-alpha-mannosidase
MLPVFDTPSGLPLTKVNLKQRRGMPDEYFPLFISTAEAATLQLEFRYLSWLTDDDVYWEKVEHVRV